MLALNESDQEFSEWSNISKYLHNTTNVLEVETSYLSTNKNLKHQSKLEFNSFTKSKNNEDLNKTTDLSSFDCKIPDEFYSSCGSKKVFRLFNRIEHIKDDTTNDLTKEDEFIDKENFRDTIHDETKFDNFNSSSKFDVIFNELSDCNETTELTYSNSKMNQHFNQKLSIGKLNQECSINKVNGEYSINKLNQHSNYDLNKSEYKSFLNSSYKNSKEIQENNLIGLRTINESTELTDDLQSKENLNNNQISPILKQSSYSKSNYLNDNLLNNYLSFKNDNHSKNDSLSKSSKRISFQLSNNQLNERSNNQVSKNNKSNSNDSSRLTRLSIENVDIFRNSISNIGQFNYSETSYLKNLDETLKNKSKQPTISDSNLPFVLSPITRVGNSNKKSDFLTTPFKRTAISKVNTNLLKTQFRNKNNQLNKNEFLDEDKLQSTFVDNETTKNNLDNLRRKSKINDIELTKNIDERLEKLKLMRPCLIKQDNISNGLTESIEQFRINIEKFKKKQLERIELKRKSFSKRTSFNTNSLENVNSVRSQLETRLNNWSNQERYTNKLSNSNNESKRKSSFSKSTSFNTNLLENVNSVRSQLETRLNNWSNQERYTNKLSNSNNESKNQQLISLSNRLPNNLTNNEKLKNHQLSCLQRSASQSNNLTKKEKSKSNQSVNETTLKERTIKDTSSISDPEDILSLEEEEEEEEEEDKYSSYNKQRTLNLQRSASQSNNLTKKEQSKSNQSVNETTLKERTIKDTSSISDAEDILSLEEEEEEEDKYSSYNKQRTLNQNYSSNKYSSLEDKEYLNYLNSKLNIVKSLEVKHKSVSKPTNKYNVISNLTNSKYFKKSNNQPIKQLNNQDERNELKNSIESLSSKTLSSKRSSSKTSSTSSIDLSNEMLNLNSILNSYSSDGSIKLNKKIDDSYHCGCCLRNILDRNILDRKVPVNDYINNQLFNKQITINQLDRNKTFNKLVQLINKDSNNNKSDDLKQFNEQSFNLNNQSLDEVFKSRRPKLYGNIQTRRELLNEKMEKRKNNESQKLMKRKTSKMSKRI